MARKSVYIAYTGGTIGMKPGNDGYRPAPGFLADQMSATAELQRPEMPRYEIHEYQPLLDHYESLAGPVNHHHDALTC